MGPSRTTFASILAMPRAAFLALTSGGTMQGLSSRGTRDNLDWG